MEASKEPHLTGGGATTLMEPNLLRRAHRCVFFPNFFVLSTLEGGYTGEPNRLKGGGGGQSGFDGGRSAAT